MSESRTATIVLSSGEEKTIDELCKNLGPNQRHVVEKLDDIIQLALELTDQAADLIKQMLENNIDHIESSSDEETPRRRGRRPK